MTIKSIPSPCFVQWIMKEKNSDSFEILDVNAEEYRGTSNSLPRPVLVIKHCEKLQTYFFQIEVVNFIGSCKKTIQGKNSIYNLFNNLTQKLTVLCLSSPELTAQVMFSDHFLSNVCPSVYFTFSTSPDPPDPFQPNLA